MSGAGDERKDEQPGARGRRGAGRSKSTTQTGAGDAGVGRQEETTGPGSRSGQPAGDASFQRARVRSAVVEEGSPRSTTPSAPGSGSPKSESPEREELAERMKEMKLIELATRPGYGTQGNRIYVFANHFQVAVPSALLLIQYHVEVTHEKIKLNRDDKRIVFWECVKQNPRIFGNKHKIAFDGVGICVTQERLVFPQTNEAGPDFTFRVKIRLNRMDRNPEDILVRFQLVGAVNMSMREVRPATAATDRFTTPLNMMDILFRQSRSYPVEVEKSRQWYPFASTVYKIPGQGGRDAHDLGWGQVIWQGLFGATRLGENYTPLINFDVSYSGFYRTQPVIDYMVEILNTKCQSHGRFSVEQLNSDTTLPPVLVEAFNKEIRGISIVTEVKPADGNAYVREHRVNGIDKQKTARTHTFKLGREDNAPELTVAEYFKQRYDIVLKYPSLQLLSVGSRKRDTYYPMELCVVKPCQRVNKKLQPDQTANMIKVTAVPAPNRRKIIDDLVKASQFDKDPWLKEFQVKVSNDMTKVEARVLPLPRIEYGGSGAPGGRGPAASKVTPRDGQWDGRGQRFYIPSGSERIGCIIIDDMRNQRDMEFFGNAVNFLLQTCRDLGMRMANLPANVVKVIPPARANADIEPTLKGLKGMGAELILVVIPVKGSPIYTEVKRSAEIIVGLMTQCMTKGTIGKLNKADRMTATNLALKINAKLGGVSWKTEADAIAKKTLEEVPTLVLGIDVTHPGPQERKAPSIASVVGNLDSTFMRYAASIRVQKHRRESIVFVQDCVRERLFEYYQFQVDQNEIRKKEGKQPIPTVKPQRIIVYRDGVAEGQFQEVLNSELVGIRQACQQLGADYKPSITLIIAQKRHHTRFFPMQGEGCGRAENIRPGTVVEKGIVHPQQFEFYLCSHIGIQGTSRPIRYHVLTDDNKLSADHMQIMTYYFSHCFARCQRPVSLPAPLYYADLACRRARIHLHDKISDFGSDTMSQVSGSGEGATSTAAASEDDMIKGSTVTPNLKMKMYFT